MPKSGENLRFLLKFDRKITKNGPKSGENFQILAKFCQKSIGKLWLKRYVTLAVRPLAPVTKDNVWAETPPPRNAFIISGRSLINNSDAIFLTQIWSFLTLIF